MKTKRIIALVSLEGTDISLVPGEEYELPADFADALCTLPEGEPRAKLVEETPGPKQKRKVEKAEAPAAPETAEA